MQKKQPKLPKGLIWRGDKIHINTTVNNEELRGPTGFGVGEINKAKVFLESEKAQKRHQQEQRKETEAQITDMKHRNLTVPPEMLGKTYGDAVKHFFSKTKHKKEKDEKDMVEEMSWCLPLDTPLNDIHASTIEPFIQEMIARKSKGNTINHYIKLVGQILNLATKKEEQGVPWRNRPHNFELMKIKKNKVYPFMNARKGYVLSWTEQDRLLNAFPEHLKDTALYSLNTGARMGEITQLRWSWGVWFDALKLFAFRIPEEYHKNGKSKLVVLNSIAKEIIDRQRGKHPEFVFTYKGGPIKRLGGTSFQRIRRTVGLSHVVFHDFRTTFSTRLKGYGVDRDTISTLMGHTIPGVTADYAFQTHIVEALVESVKKLEERKNFTFVPVDENISRTNLAHSFKYVSEMQPEDLQIVETKGKKNRDGRIRTCDHSTPS